MIRLFRRPVPMQSAYRPYPIQKMRPEDKVFWDWSAKKKEASK